MLQIKKLDHVNVFILSYNRIDYTTRCVESIQKYVTLPKKIFICDNNSNEETKEKLRILEKQENIKVYFNNNNRWVCGFNIAINENLEDVFVITDNDIVLHDYAGKDVINHMYMILQKYDRHSIGLNFYQSNKIYSEVAVNKDEGQPPDIFMNTHFLDTTFQVMRKDMFTSWDTTHRVEFCKQHMGYRKMCYNSKGSYSGVGFTADPWFCMHIGGMEEELKNIKNGDKDFLQYWKDKVNILSVESPTQYPAIVKFLNEEGEKYGKA